MRISDDQLAILNSFSVVRINDRDDFLRQVDDFKNDRNENLVTYIQGDAFDDDKSGNVACYIVTDSDSENPLLFFLSDAARFTANLKSLNFSRNIKC